MADCNEPFRAEQILTAKLYPIHVPVIKEKKIQKRK